VHTGLGEPSHQKIKLIQKTSTKDDKFILFVTKRNSYPFLGGGGNLSGVVLPGAFGVIGRVQIFVFVYALLDVGSYRSLKQLGRAVNLVMNHSHWFLNQFSNF
jgi:hypothetical protein